MPSKEGSKNNYGESSSTTETEWLWFPAQEEEKSASNWGNITDIFLSMPE